MRKEVGSMSSAHKQEGVQFNLRSSSSLRPENQRLLKTLEKLAAEPGTSVHLYGKHEARAGRKMGHVNRIRPKTR